MDEMFGMVLDVGDEGDEERCGREVKVWAYGDHAPGVRP
jgi:hypothetical protein